MERNSWQTIKLVMRREYKRLTRRPLYLFSMVVAPLFTVIFFTTLMSDGLPKDMPIGIVDLDNTATTRTIFRYLDAMEQTKIVKEYKTVRDARKDLQRGRIYSFFYVPKGTTEDVLAFRRPKISFYTNYSYLMAGSLIYRDQKTMSELANAAVARALSRAYGKRDDNAVNEFSAISIESHIIGNPWMNYSIYLSNIIVPGILSLLIFLTTIFAVGGELKFKTEREWMELSGGKISLALVGKLLPHLIIYTIVAIFIDIYFYSILGYPCKCGLPAMMLISLLFVLASMSFGLFLFGLISTLRLAMSVASLWGVVSFSISGMSFPVIAMSPILRGLAMLFPLRHYYLIYTGMTLNGFSFTYVWQSIVALLIFCMLPFVVLKHLKTIVNRYEYIP